MIWSGLVRYHRGGRILVEGMERIWMKRQEEEEQPEWRKQCEKEHQDLKRGLSKEPPAEGIRRIIVGNNSWMGRTEP